LLPSVVGNRALPFISDSLEALLGRRGMVSKMKTMVEYGSGNFADSLKVSRIFGFEHRDKLYSGEFKYHLQEHEPTDIYQEYLAEADGLNEVDKALYIDIKTRLPNDYLTKVDVATMMNSLEARSPFLDYEVMEFAGKIPSNIKLKYGKPKYLLKKLAEKYVPADAIYRKKWGFGIPIGFWFRDNLYSLLKEVLLSDKSMKRGYFNSRYVGKLVDDHLAGRVDHTHRLWTLLCLELWHLIFIDRSIISQSDVLKTSL
jgi:asparagine synthase (glutamine-hydrolysing)